MNLTAKAYLVGAHNNREFWYEEDCWSDFISFFALEVPTEELNKSQRIRKETFRRNIERVIANAYTRDIFEKECHGLYCIWSMKFFKGGQNTRAFCHYAIVGDKERFTFCALIPKKKAQKLSKRELDMIETIGKYVFTYIDLV